MKDLLQAVLEDPEFDEYFHIKEVPGRKPLHIVFLAERDTVSGLSKFGVPVVVSSPVERCAACLVIGSIELRDNAARVEVQFAPEGISARFHLKLGSAGWIVERRTIVENIQEFRRRE